MSEIERRIASERMTEAWKDMLQNNSMTPYNEMSLERVSDLIKQKSRPKKEEQFIANYLKALSDWLNHKD